MIFKLNPYQEGNRLEGCENSNLNSIVYIDWPSIYLVQKPRKTFKKIKTDSKSAI